MSVPTRSPSYPYEKFMVAVSGMATSPASLKQRLENAFLSFHTIEHADFDDHPDLGEMFAPIHAAYRATPAVADEGTAAASMRALDDQGAIDLAGKIVELFLAIAREEREGA